MLVYVTEDDPLRYFLMEIYRDSPPHYTERTAEVPDELVARYEKAESEFAEVQELLKGLLDG